ncbi:hypothetical protein MAQA_15471 [Listeria aquatica FSL S10-1188]|uniref:Uncharacterized protein n=1 Tax=Listeria aquatica FSL S10-1188 TaxID=1265818 RepID=W7ATV1_9LIST|nr:hypothetical protein MAQA_15471 [Listeria aquatica FSL S10-1188]
MHIFSQSTRSKYLKQLIARRFQQILTLKVRIKMWKFSFYVTKLLKLNDKTVVYNIYYVFLIKSRVLIFLLYYPFSSPFIQKHALVENFHLKHAF